MNYTQKMVSDHGNLGRVYEITEVLPSNAGTEPRVFNISTLDEAEIPSLVAMAANPPPSPTISLAGNIDAERDRRINGGFIFEGVEYQSRPEDRENIAGAATAALGAIVAGAQPGDLRWHGGAEDFAWIAADNTMHTMDAQTVYAFGQAAMAHKQAHIFAARTLKDADPIPDDFADDQWWP